MPSPPSTRPSGARGRRSFVFVREDGETATDSALLVGHHHRLDRRDQFATMVAFAIWLISLALGAPRADGARPPDLTKSPERSEGAFAKSRRPYFASRSAQEQNRDGGI